MTVRLTRLANGLRVVSEHMPSIHSAALGVWVGAGGRHERAEENGVAHFLEHMAFKGTRRRTARQIAEEIEGVGGWLNAYTSKEVTSYHARVLDRDLPLALDVIADILLESSLEPAEIEVERGVILQEIGQVRDTPDDVIFDWLQETAFPDQPLGRSILGPPEIVRRVTRDDLAGFITRTYRPESMVLAAVGAVDHDSLVAQAERLFASLSPGAAPRPEPARFAGGERREAKALEQAHFALGLQAPSITDAGYHAAQVFANALGGGMSSRLFQEVRERLGLCYTIFAQYAAWSDTGLMTVYSGTGGDDIATLSRTVADELRRATEELTEAEVARARAQLRAGLVMGLETPMARAERMARQLLLFGRVIPLTETVEQIEAVTVAGAREAGRQMLDRPRPALALYGPVERAPSLDELGERLAA